MPRFPVAFNRRKSNADTLDNAVAGPSFRVLDRSEVVSSHGHSHSTSNGNNTLNGNGNSASRFAVKSQSMPNTLAVDNEDDNNLFANLNANRGSANTTNTNSTDNSSRHSNVSTAPSSADLNAQQQQQQQQQYHQYQQQQQQPQQQDDDWKAQGKKQYGDIPMPPIPKSSTTSSFLKSAGRTLSFGGNKKHLPVLPDDGKPPQTPPTDTNGGRDRSMTASTVTTATPPKIEEEFTLDLGGDFSKMLGNFDNKRASVATLRMGQQINGDKKGDKNGDTDRPALVPRSLTGNRLNQPAPIQVDHAAKIEPSPYSWSSQNSNDKLLYSHNLDASANENAPPAVPRHASPLALGESATSPTSNDSGLRRSSAVFGRRRSTVEYVAEAEDEDTVLLKDSLFSVNRFLAGSGLSNNKTSSTSPSSRFGRRHDDTLDSSYSKVPTESTSPPFGAKAVADDEDNLFDNSIVHSSRTAQKFVARKPSPPRNKVMTPAQFERYRKDKEREDASKTASAGDAYNKKASGNNSDSEDDDKYEDDVDEAEKSRQAAKQRRKQEAHMAVYRQQMMKVTGETSATGPAARSSIYFSMSTPNLPSLSGTSPQNGSEVGGNEDDDEEVPLAILAAHGFPNRNRPPTRLSTMMSNPNLRAAAAPSYQRPQSAIGGDAHQPQQPQQPQQAAGGNGGRLPVFARNLPQDPYGLINSNQRETLNFAGGAPAASGGLPPGGLVGVIASEERSRAMRRGSPALDAIQKPLPNMSGTNPHYDPMGGIPAQMMYPGVGAGMGGQMPMMSPADQAQIQMTQQMQQFMQMQMQFMQMMTNGGNGQRPMSQYGSVQGAPMGMGNMGNMGLGMGGMGGDGSVRHSFADNGSMLDLQLPRPDMHSRTMSMVQPSSASWIQPPQHNMGGGYAPSIRVQGAGNGYTPSIAPSERSNVGMPGRYRPVSHLPPAVGGTSPLLEPSPGPTSGASSPGWDISRKHKSPSPLQKEAVTAVAAVDDDDDEEGWAAMKAKRDKKRSMWKSKKTLSSELGALIS
ncbi:hypothetical protein F503_06999 [Ophiostoma piceae UAMH 11346]|uniref:Uncharacterized protein n=1 Tax=Ophiostoma piceae (strain UAMH 11346) TaxID=1262450 RepID=S3CRJ0_OPHP1|nr:hypothetical protein F503_06999 [Ophiostoma piceae UAMH 11346]